MLNLSPEDARRKLVTEYRWSAETLDLWIRADFRCEYCGVDLLSSVDYGFYCAQLDHIIPLSKAGEDEPCNIAVACRTCNFLKRNDPFSVAGDEADKSKIRETQIPRIRKFIEERRTAKLMELAENRQLALLLRKTR